MAAILAMRRMKNLYTRDEDFLARSLITGFIHEKILLDFSSFLVARTLVYTVLLTVDSYESISKYGAQFPPILLQSLIK